MKLKEKLKAFLKTIKIDLQRYLLLPCTAYCGRVPTTELVKVVFNFCELYSGRTFYPYQEQFSKRIIRSVITNDGEEITALFARQSGKTETNATTIGGMMIILPQMANMPMFADDSRLSMFKDGLWVGIFAPSLRQSQTAYGRLKARLQSKSAQAILNSPEFRLEFSTSNGQTVSLTNGSFVSAISASETANIEGESFKLIVCEEAQDISSFKVRKSIHPMGAAYNASIIKIGTATTFKSDFYEAIQRNKKHQEKVNRSPTYRNHFEYDWRVAAKYNSWYAKYIEREKKRLGEKSDEFRMSYCVTPDTRILTSDLRWVKAKDIKTGDTLIGFDENVPKRYGQREYKKSVVEDVGRITRPCYRVTLEDGKVVTCSAEHRWLVFTAGSRTEWKETKDLKSTDRIYKACDVWEHKKDYETGYLSAAFDGEGCLTQVYTLGTLRCSNGGNDYVHPLVVNLEYVGEQEVIPIRTSTRTYIAEGLASHNCLEWVIERGMFLDIEKFEHDNTEPLLERTMYDKRATHVAGIDLGGKGDDTIITMVEVNWDMPVSIDSFINENNEEETYTTYCTYLKDWCVIANEPDYEEQYPIIIDYLAHFLLARVVCDATKEASVSHRLRANLKCEVIPFIFTTKSKSEVYKHLDREITSGRARVCAGPQTVETPEYKEFLRQLGELQKGWSGTHMLVSHSNEKDHDDFPDSWALAVWGTSFKGEVNNTETLNNKFTARTNNQKRGVRARNRLTAQRRR